MRFLPAGARGLLLTGMLAAWHRRWTPLELGASCFANDLYKRLYCEVWRKTSPSERSLVWVARGSNLLILALSLVVLTQLRSIQSAWSISFALRSRHGAPLLLRWLWWRVSAACELAAVAASLVTAPLLLHFVSGEALRLLWMTLITSSTVLVVAWAFPADLRRSADVLSPRAASRVLGSGCGTRRGAQNRSLREGCGGVW